MNGRRLQIVGLVECWRCGCSWCPLYWRHPPDSPLLFPVVGPDFVVETGILGITDPVPYLPCSGCGQVSGRLRGAIDVVPVGQ